LIFKGSVYISGAGPVAPGILPGLNGQGFVLHNFVRIGSPTQGNPPFSGGLQNL